MGYRTASKRLGLGNVIADSWAGERELAVALYAGARSLAQEIRVRVVRVGSTGRTNHPRERGSFATGRAFFEPLDPTL